MAKFKVWDECCQSEGTASEYDAYDAEDAACKYADADSDGQADQVYESGHEIMTRGPDGELRKFKVSVEYEPRFYATQIEGKPSPAEADDVPY